MFLIVFFKADKSIASIGQLVTLSFTPDTHCSLAFFSAGLTPTGSDASAGLGLFLPPHAKPHSGFV